MNDRKAALYMMLSAFSFSFMQMAVKFTSQSVPVYEQVFVRNLIMLVIATVSLKMAGKPLYRDKKNFKGLFFRGFFGMIGVLLYFYATKHLPSADAAILQKSSPFFVAIFSVLFLKERITKLEVLAFVIAFAGTIFVTKPSLSHLSLPSLAGLFSAIFAALAYVIISTLKGKEDNFTIMLSFSVITTVFMLPLVIFQFYLPSFVEILGLLAIGTAGAFGQYFLTKSYTMAQPGIVSIYNYTNVIFSAVLGYIFFRDTIDTMSFIGIVLIFGAAYLVYKSKTHSLKDKTLS
ncbi:MAG: DMT family transporter [Tissierellia bacterium]|nr:DMT family transporter [Tissierellia bacterium]